MWAKGQAGWPSVLPKRRVRSREGTGARGGKEAGHEPAIALSCLGQRGEEGWAGSEVGQRMGRQGAWVGKGTCGLHSGAQVQRPAGMEQELSFGRTGQQLGKGGDGRCGTGDGRRGSSCAGRTRPLPPRLASSFPARLPAYPHDGTPDRHNTQTAAATGVGVQNNQCTNSKHLPRRRTGRRG